jgi:hypothetical protein
VAYFQPSKGATNYKGAAMKEQKPAEQKQQAVTSKQMDEAVLVKPSNLKNVEKRRGIRI